MSNAHNSQTPALLTLAIDPDHSIWGVIAPQTSAQSWVLASANAPAGEQLLLPEMLAAAQASDRVRASAPMPSSTTSDAVKKLKFDRLAAEAKVAGHLQSLDLRLLSAHTPALGKRDSLRLGACWFGDEYAAAVCAERAKGHEADRDEVNVALAGERWPSVEDPRLSTTRDRDGVPLRLTLQTWLSDGPDDDLHPWQIVGSRVGPTLSMELGEHVINACMLECYRREQPGVGVLAIISPR